MKKHILVFLTVFLGVFSLCLIGYISYVNFYKSNDVEEIIPIEEKPIVEEEPKIDSQEIVVEIKGAVANPGVYRFDDKAIIDDLVEAAGGLNYNAYTNNINFSKKLQNEMVIYVYTSYEYHNLNQKEAEVKECNCPKVDITPCIDNGSSIIVSSDNVQEQAENNQEEQSTLININTASASELQSLNGIGEAKAKSIIAYREENGLFQTIEDIKKVSGISETIYAKIKDNITI